MPAQVEHLVNVNYDQRVTEYPSNKNIVCACEAQKETVLTVLSSGSKIIGNLIKSHPQAV